MVPTAPHPVYLDCDTGVDDSLAIAYLLAVPGIELTGIGTVSGNTDAHQAARNTAALLQIGGHEDIPVSVGASGFLTHEYAPEALHVHGPRGTGNVDLPAADRSPGDESASDLLIRLSHEHAGRLRIIAIGPLTNLAIALVADPSLPSRIASVTVMGGAAHVPGNVTPVAEANIHNDPEAAHRVLRADWDVTLVPLDVTMANVFEEEHRALLLRSANPLARVVGDVLDHYFDFHVREYGRRCSALHDPLAAAIAVGGIVPAVCPAVPIEIDTTGGPGRGQTVCDLRGQRTGAVDHDGIRTRVVLDAGTDLAAHLLAMLS